MIFEIEKGSFRYRTGERTLLEDIDLSVKSGDILAILGPNGAGKTTLLKCALGLLKWQKGRSLLDGKDIKDMSCRRLWQKISYVPQAKHTSLPYTVREMVLIGRNSHIGNFSLPGKEDEMKADEAINMLGLEHIKDKKCSEISGGELQMTLIARALSTGPEMLVLDEPESNLDFKNQLMILDIMTYLAESGIACIFNTHYPAHALRRANRSFILGRNGNFRYGNTEDIVTEKNIAEYFGVAAAIGDIETAHNVYRDVVPVSTDTSYVSYESESGTDRIATISIIMPDSSRADLVNRAIKDASPIVIGRMGMPHTSAGIYMINLMIDGPDAEIQRLLSALNKISGISAKATYAREKNNG